MTDPRDMTDELRYGGEGLEVLERMREEIQADWRRWLAGRTRNAREAQGRGGDTLRGMAVQIPEESAL